MNEPIFLDPEAGARLPTKLFAIRAKGRPPEGGRLKTFILCTIKAATANDKMERLRKWAEKGDEGSLEGELLVAELEWVPVEKAEVRAKKAA